MQGPPHLALRRFVLASAALGLLLLAGCASPSRDAQADGTYGCDRCLATADEDAARGHFENFLASAALDDQHLVVAACSFDGQRFQVTAHTSFDQGRTWTTAQIPYGERVPLDHPLRSINFAADPGVAISADGQTVVVAAVGLTTVPLEEPSGNLPLQSAMFVARSDDGGRTFPVDGVHVLQQSVQTYPAVQDFSDHPRIVVGADGTFLVMWGSLDLPDPLAAGRFLETQDPLLVSSLEVRFSASFDGGLTWSTPAIAYQDTDLHYYPPSPLVLADGSWAVMPSQYNGGDGKVFFSRSEDQGRSWSWQETPMMVSGFGTAAAGPDGRLYYSYNEAPLDPSGGVRAMLATADGPDASWTIQPLTDGPSFLRLGIENMLVLDGRGVPHVLHGWRPEPGAPGEIRVTSVDPGAGLMATTLESGLESDRVFGHYLGLTGTKTGAVATWPVAHQVDKIWRPDAPLVAGVVEWT